MLIECIDGPVSTDVMGVTYVFEPDEFGRSVVEVFNPQHIRVMLSVKEHYRRVEKELSEVTLTSIDPTEAQVGSVDVTLTCTGTGFLADSVIVFNGGEEPTIFVSDTELTTVVKPSTAVVTGALPVFVRNFDGVESEQLEFTFTEAAPLADSPAVAGSDGTPGDVMPVTLITGIGPALETKLEGIGVTDVRQIAAWTDEQAAQIDVDLALGGRIARDDWIGQAKALVAG